MGPEGRLSALVRILHELIAWIGLTIDDRRDPEMRLFIAIMLSDDMKKAVTGTMHELKKADVRGSYVPAQNLHVTLAFIGETKDASSVKTAMQSLSCKPFGRSGRQSLRP